MNAAEKNLVRMYGPRFMDIITVTPSLTAHGHASYTCRFAGHEARGNLTATEFARQIFGTGVLRRIGEVDMTGGVIQYVVLMPLPKKAPKGMSMSHRTWK